MIKKMMTKKKTMLAIIMKKLRAVNDMHSITLIEILEAPQTMVVVSRK
jgi:hypothetical protein